MLPLLLSLSSFLECVKPIKGTDYSTVDNYLKWCKENDFPIDFQFIDYFIRAFGIVLVISYMFIILIFVYLDLPSVKTALNTKSLSETPRTRSYSRQTLEACKSSIRVPLRRPSKETEDTIQVLDKPIRKKSDELPNQSVPSKEGVKLELSEKSAKAPGSKIFTPSEKTRKKASKCSEQKLSIGLQLSAPPRMKTDNISSIVSGEAKPSAVSKALEQRSSVISAAKTTVASRMKTAKVLKSKSNSSVISGSKLSTASKISKENTLSSIPGAKQSKVSEAKPSNSAKPRLSTTSESKLQPQFKMTPDATSTAKESDG